MLNPSQVIAKLLGNPQPVIPPRYERTSKHAGKGRMKVAAGKYHAHKKMRRRMEVRSRRINRSRTR